MDIQALRDEHYNATVLSVRRLHETLMIIRVVSDVGKLEYLPGQYTILALGGWEDRFDGPSSIEDETLRNKLIKRAYSIACPLFNEQLEPVCCADYDFIEFYITLVPRPDHEAPKRPPLTPRLFALQVGDRVHLSTHVVGHYTAQHITPDKNVLFAATGTGEAPHNAMIAQLLRQGHTGKIVSLTCVRYRADAGYVKEQIVLNDRFPNYRYDLFTTREPENLDPQHPQYVGKQYLQDVLTADRFQQQYGWSLDPTNTHVFLCGNPDMIGIPHKNPDGLPEFPAPPGMLELLHQRGFSIDPHDPHVNVHYEKYW